VKEKEWNLKGKKFQILWRWCFKFCCLVWDKTIKKKFRKVIFYTLALNVGDVPVFFWQISTTRLPLSPLFLFLFSSPSFCLDLSTAVSRLESQTKNEDRRMRRKTPIASPLFLGIKVQLKILLLYLRFLTYSKTCVNGPMWITTPCLQRPAWILPKLCNWY